MGAHKWGPISIIGNSTPIHQTLIALTGSILSTKKRDKAKEQLRI